MVAAKGLTDTQTLAPHARRLERAAARTPHGTPIELRPDDFRN